MTVSTVITNKTLKQTPICVSLIVSVSRYSFLVTWTHCLCGPGKAPREKTIFEYKRVNPLISYDVARGVRCAWNQEPGASLQPDGGAHHMIHGT